MTQADGRRAVGVLGGTFDPVHLGHLHLADGVRRALALPRVLLVPTGEPPHKPAPTLCDSRHREEMLRLASADREGLEVCTYELERTGPSYTIDTLRALRDGSPPCRPVFVLGMDALLQIMSWKESEALLDEFDLAVVDRKGDELEGARLAPSVSGRIVPVPARPAEGSFAGHEPGRGGRIFHVPLIPLPISASEVRERAATGRGLSDLVPPAVARYIRSAGLYRQEERC